MSLSSASPRATTPPSVPTAALANMLSDDPVADEPIPYALTEGALVEPTGIAVSLARIRAGTAQRWARYPGARGVLLVPGATVDAIFAEGGRA